MMLISWLVAAAWFVNDWYDGWKNKVDALEDKVSDIEERIKNIEEFTEWFKRSVDMKSLVVDTALWEYERIQQAQADQL